jgi:hypothetical protein
MARRDRLVEEVKLGGIWVALLVGVIVALGGGVAGLALREYPELRRFAMWAGIVAITVAAGAIVFAIVYVTAKLKQLERS